MEIWILAGEWEDGERDSRQWRVYQLLEMDICIFC